MSYCHGFGIHDPDEIAETLLYVQNMDQVFRERAAKKAAKSGDIESMRNASKR